MDRIFVFAELVADFLNPNAPGKAEMRNCDRKWEAIQARTLLG